MSDQAPSRKDILYAIILAPNYKGANLNFKGYAKSISSVNSEGNFDILPEHENFVTEIKQKVVIFDQGGQKVEYAIEKGLIEASNNQVKIYVEF